MQLPLYMLIRFYFQSTVPVILNYLITIWTCYTCSDFTSNKHLHLVADQSTNWVYVYSSNYDSDVVGCITLETSLNDFSLWCIGSCIGSHYTPTGTSASSELHCDRCHTLRWCCCAPAHSSTRSWAIHTLSTHSDSIQWKLSTYECMRGCECGCHINIKLEHQGTQSQQLHEDFIIRIHARFHVYNNTHAA